MPRRGRLRTLGAPGSSTAISTRFFIVTTRSMFTRLGLPREYPQAMRVFLPLMLILLVVIVALRLLPGWSFLARALFDMAAIEVFCMSLGLTLVHLGSLLSLAVRVRCMRCGRCGYDLRGISTKHCPECGSHRPTDSELRRAWMKFVWLLPARFPGRNRRRQKPLRHAKLLRNVVPNTPE